MASIPLQGTAELVSVQASIGGESVPATNEGPASDRTGARNSELRIWTDIEIIGCALLGLEFRLYIIKGLMKNLKSN